MAGIDKYSDNSPMVSRFTLRLPRELNDKLIDEAEKNQRSKNSMIITILEIYLSTKRVAYVDERWLALKND